MSPHCSARSCTKSCTRLLTPPRPSRWQLKRPLEQLSSRQACARCQLSCLSIAQSPPPSRTRWGPFGHWGCVLVRVWCTSKGLGLVVGVCLQSFRSASFHFLRLIVHHCGLPCGAADECLVSSVLRIWTSRRFSHSEAGSCLIASVPSSLNINTSPFTTSFMLLPPIQTHAAYHP